MKGVSEGTEMLLLGMNGLAAELRMGLDTGKLGKFRLVCGLTLSTPIALVPKLGGLVALVGIMGWEVPEKDPKTCWALLRAFPRE